MIFTKIEKGSIMEFMFYNRKHGNLMYTGENFQLAGYNLIFSLWEKRNRPTDQGWHICADDLIREYTSNEGYARTNALLIDFDPNSWSRIGIIELLDIYAYTSRRCRERRRVDPDDAPFKGCSV